MSIIPTALLIQIHIHYFWHLYTHNQYDSNILEWTVYWHSAAF